MKKSFLTLVLFSCALCMNAQDTLRIMTFNLYSGGLASMEELGKYIKQFSPDIVAVQEVDLRTNRPETPNQRGKNQMAELGYFSDLLPIFGSINNYPTGGYYGMGFLSKNPIQSIVNIPLPQVVDKKEPRSMIVAQWNINGKQLTIANTHLSLDINNREVQLKHIRKYMKKVKGAKIVCGDLNSTPEEGLIPNIFKTWNDALPEGVKTFSCWNPTYKYDWILYDPKCNIQVINSQVDQSIKLSDHFPCIIDIVLK